MTASCHQYLKNTLYQLKGRYIIWNVLTGFFTERSIHQISRNSMILIDQKTVEVKPIYLDMTCCSLFDPLVHRRGIVLVVEHLAEADADLYAQ